MRQFEIVPTQEGKGRTFTSLCPAMILADGIWANSTDDINTWRPVWAMFASSENELRPFMMNAQLGRKIEEVSRRDAKRLEMLKSARYHVTYQREAEGTVATAYLPDFFRLDPGMVDPAQASFILLPTREWFDAQRIDPKPLVDHTTRTLKDGARPDEDLLATLAPISYLFAAYLDRRTRFPLLADGRFYLQLLCSCLSKGLAMFPEKLGDRGYGGYGGYYRDAQWGYNRNARFFAEGLEDVGLLTPIAFHARHDDFGELLAEEVSRFFQVTGGH